MTEQNQDVAVPKSVFFLAYSEAYAYSVKYSSYFRVTKLKDRYSQETLLVNRASIRIQVFQLVKEFFRGIIKSYFFKS